MLPYGTHKAVPALRRRGEHCSPVAMGGGVKLLGRALLAPTFPINPRKLPYNTNSRQLASHRLAGDFIFPTLLYIGLLRA